MMDYEDYKVLSAEHKEEYNFKYGDISSSIRDFGSKSLLLFIIVICNFLLMIITYFLSKGLYYKISFLFDYTTYFCIGYSIFLGFFTLRNIYLMYDSKRWLDSIKSSDEHEWRFKNGS